MLPTIALLTTLSAAGGLMGHCGKPCGGRMHHVRTRAVSTCAAPAPAMMTPCGTAAPGYALRTMAAPMGMAAGTPQAMTMAPAPSKVAPTPMAPAKGMPMAASKTMPMASPAAGAVYASPSTVPPAPEVPAASAPSAPAPPAPPAPPSS